MRIASASAPLVAPLILALSIGIAATAADSRASLEQQFQGLTSGLNPQDKNTPGREWRILASLLDRCDEATRKREFERVLREPMARTNAFDNRLTEVFASELCDQWNTNLLLQIFSKRCPDYVAGMPLEFSLAKARGTEGVILLADAFASKAANQESRVVLVRCLERALPTIRTNFSVEKDFVAACKRWAEENSTNHWRLNFEYPYLPSIGLPTGGDGPVKVGLFQKAKTVRP